MVNIIPKPNKIKYTNDNFVLNMNTTISGDSFFNENIEYLKSILKINVNEDGIIKLFKDDSLYEEEYILTIKKDNIVIKASTNKGCFYAINSFLQIIPFEIMKNGIKKEIEIETLEIKDKPLLSYRSFMIDVSRHFFNKEVIYRLIDKISFFKFNTLHFHVSDDQGFRLDLKKYPLLREKSTSRIGSQVEGILNTFKIKIDDKEVSGYYTEEDIKDILNYAKKRYIKVIPEIDVPGHMEAIIFAYNEYLCEGFKEVQVRNRWGISKNVLCIGNEKSLDFVTDIILETAKLFETDTIHIGGDECPTSHYKKCPKCRDYLKRNNIDNVSSIQGFFTNELIKKLRQNNLNPIIWNEAISKYLDNDTIIEYWTTLKESSNVFEKVKKGNKLIVAPFTAYYLDYSYEFFSLKDTYNYDLFYNEKLGSEYKNNVYGVECPLWTEWIRGEKKIDFQAFPRSLAVIERGWTNEEQIDYSDFLNRLEYVLKGFDLFNICYATKECYMQEFKGNKIKRYKRVFLHKKFISDMEYSKYINDEENY